MSRPKDLRERLFWNSRPEIRDANGEDRKWIRLSQKLTGDEMSDEDFVPWIEHTFSVYQEVLIVEDDNSRFGAGRGPVAIVGAKTNGYLYEPHVEWFEWATSKNKLRASVAFFQKFRYRNLGVIRVHALEPAEKFFRKLKKYVPLFPVGRIPGGDHLGRGDDYIFYMKCRGVK